MCSVFRIHNPVPLSYFTTYRSILTSDMTGATDGTVSQPKINKIIKCFGSTQLVEETVLPGENHRLVSSHRVHLAWAWFEVTK
jgi:hypothetical protein